MVKKVLSLMVVLFAVLQVAALAAVITLASHTGTVKIMAPDGTVMVLAAGDVAPGSIVDGSTIEVVDGDAVFAIDGDTVSMDASDVIKIVEGGINDGINVIKGEVVLNKANGTKLVLRAPKAEPYTPPDVLGTQLLGTDIEKEEQSKDISTVK